MPTYTSTSSQPYAPNMNHYSNPARRTLSTSTSSTTASGTSPGQSSSQRLRRSSSGRSGGSSNSPTSYVALMRKQKATVWCDRAQQEDPRILAQQRAAKMRAAMEVVGGHHAAHLSAGARSSLGLAGGVRSKIRHHTAVKPSTYTPANLSGSGVPMRLSASEVDEGDSDDADPHSGVLHHHQHHTHHHRTGSDRSSIGSGRRFTGAFATPPHAVGSSNTAGAARFSTADTPPSGHDDSSPPDDDDDGVAELADETPVPGKHGPASPNRRPDYFARQGSAGHGASTSATHTGLSGNSSSSGEREQGFGQLGAMQERGRDERYGGVSGGVQGTTTMPTRLRTNTSTTEDLRRRGSVDERTGTMSGAVRLFVANPDLSD